MNRLILFGLIACMAALIACEHPVYTYFVLTQNAGNLKAGDEVVIDGIDVGKAVAIHHPADFDQYFMIQLELLTPVNLPVNSDFIFPDSSSDALQSKLFVTLKPSEKSYSVGDTINLLDKKSSAQTEVKIKQAPNEIKSESSRETNPTIAKKVEGLVYRVQIRTSKYAVDIHAPMFKGLNPLVCKKEAALNKYYFGHAETLTEARILRKQALKKGFSDAFIVAFQGNHRISIAEAARLEN